MSERRSSRARKTISYSRFDEGSDDDFADSTPPLKKTKTKNEKKKCINNEEKEKSGRAVLNEEPILDLESSLRSKKQRLNVRDKVFDRELEEALQLSILETGGSQADYNTQATETLPPPILSPNPTEFKSKSVENVPQQPPLLSPQANSDEGKSKSNQTLVLSPQANSDEGKNKSNETLVGIPFTTVMDDRIDVLDDVKVAKDEGKSSRGRQVKKRSLKIEADSEAEEESDFAPDAESDSQGEDEDVSDDDEDEDFAVKSKSNKKLLFKTKAKAPTKKVKLTETKHKNIANINTKKPTLKSSENIEVKSLPPKRTSTIDTSKSVTSKKPPVSATAAVKPAPARCAISSPSQSMRASQPPSALCSQWKPPAFASHGSNNTPVVKSPSSGLRLGLSRNQRVKSLHSSVNVT